MFKSADGEPDIVFPFPLFTTCVHMIVQFTLASLVLYLFPRFRPRHDSINPHAPPSQQRARSQSPPDPSKPIMTQWFYLTRIGPCGAATGLDIGLGNMSLKFISMTFYSMCCPYSHPVLHKTNQLTKLHQPCASPPSSASSSSSPSSSASKPPPSNSSSSSPS